MLSSFPTEEEDRTKESQSNATSLPFGYFLRQKPDDLNLFFNHHPQQNSKTPVLQKAFFCKNGTNRKWLSYSDDTEALYCSVCMAFGRPTDSSTFLNGMKDWEHVHQRLEEHEKSIMHRDCAEAYFLWVSKADNYTESIYQQSDVC